MARVYSYTPLAALCVRLHSGQSHPRQRKGENHDPFSFSPAFRPVTIRSRASGNRFNGFSISYA